MKTVGQGGAGAHRIVLNVLVHVDHRRRRFERRRQKLSPPFARPRQHLAQRGAGADHALVRRPRVRLEVRRAPCIPRHLHAARRTPIRDGGQVDTRRGKGGRGWGGGTCRQRRPHARWYRRGTRRGKGKGGRERQVRGRLSQTTSHLSRHMLPRVTRPRVRSFCGAKPAACGHRCRGNRDFGAEVAQHAARRPPTPPDSLARSLLRRHRLLIWTQYLSLQLCLLPATHPRLSHPSPP